MRVMPFTYKYNLAFLPFPISGNLSSKCILFSVRRAGRSLTGGSIACTKINFPSTYKFLQLNLKKIFHRLYRKSVHQTELYLKNSILYLAPYLSRYQYSPKNWQEVYGYRPSTQCYDSPKGCLDLLDYSFLKTYYPNLCLNTTLLSESAINTRQK